jgi:hypothetical protein
MEPFLFLNIRMLNGLEDLWELLSNLVYPGPEA